MADLNPGTRKFNFYRKTYKQYPELTLAKAKEIGDKIGVDWARYDLGEFRQGIKEEMEHGNEYGPVAKVHDDDFTIAARIACAHLEEFPDYYQGLEAMEGKHEAYWDEENGDETKRKQWISNNYKEEQEILKAEGITDLPAAA